MYIYFVEYIIIIKKKNKLNNNGYIYGSINSVEFKAIIDNYN